METCFLQTITYVELLQFMEFHVLQLMACAKICAYLVSYSTEKHYILVQ